MQPESYMKHPENEPVVVSIPEGAKIDISGTTNADFHQRVTIKEIGKDDSYIFEGHGESAVMNLKTGGNRLAVERATGSGLRTWTFDFENSENQQEYRHSKVLRPVYKTVYNNDYKVSKMEWEIVSEDNVDDDYNDAIIHIVADFE
ncbi:hypothetical protein BDV25DRAFT_118860 [Aspergillus avenaceus]|uniref:Uncharacterized protein n=1 Tax=Aspergillus avenaceus TaxID=36643 RepID=A0A5N6TUF9_ASPAV|nr:hypothetical protein BDV25DRAFT_118860 [Aspergillus avenaceus]